MCFMIAKIKRLEQGVVSILNLDGWSLKCSENEFECYDAIGKTPKKIECVFEMKFRDKYYPTKMLEKSKYDSLMKLDALKLYYVNDPKGTYIYILDKLKLPPVEKRYCPSTTLWNNTMELKEVYLLGESLAAKIKFH